MWDFGKQNRIYKQLKVSHIFHWTPGVRDRETTPRVWWEPEKLKSVIRWLKNNTDSHLQQSKSQHKWIRKTDKLWHINTGGTVPAHENRKQKTSSGRTSDQWWGFTRQKKNEQLHSKRQLPKKIAALTNSPHTLGTDAQQTKDESTRNIRAHSERTEDQNHEQKENQLGLRKSQATDQARMRANRLPPHKKSDRAWVGPRTESEDREEKRCRQIT
jgi:hypothetical protein